MVIGTTGNRKIPALTESLRAAHRRDRFPAIVILLLAALPLPAQDVVTLEQAGSRNPADFSAVYEGRAITVRAQVAAPVLWAFGMYYLPLRDSSEYGLIVRGEHDQLASFEPGDWVEARGKIGSRAGLPLLNVESIEKVRQGTPPLVKSMSLSDAATLRNLGLLMETHGTVSRIGENTGGTIVQIGDRGTAAVAFLPRSPAVRTICSRESRSASASPPRAC